MHSSSSDIIIHGCYDLWDVYVCGMFCVVFLFPLSRTDQWGVEELEKEAAECESMVVYSERDYVYRECLGVCGERVVSFTVFVCTT